MTAGDDHWTILANYESSDLVRRCFKAVHKRTLSAAKAFEICASFVQARGYMEAARSADRIVRPLLVYYGVLGLSRALTLFLSHDLSEAGLSQSHGLTVTGWGEELSRQTGSVAALTIRLNANGTFRQLLEATKHESLLRNNNSRPNVSELMDVPPAEAEISLADLLSRLPEIASVYRRWRDDRNLVPIWPQGPLPDGRYKIRISHGYTMEDVLAVLGPDATQMDESGASALFISVPDTAPLPYTSDVTERWNVGSLVAMRPYPGDVQLSKIATAFAASYALGMLVRYYPSHWIGMLHNRAHDGAMPSLLATLEHVETEFPRFVVEFLERPIARAEG